MEDINVVGGLTVMVDTLVLLQGICDMVAHTTHKKPFYFTWLFLSKCYSL